MGEVARRDWLRRFVRPGFLLIALFEAALIALNMFVFSDVSNAHLLPFEIFNAVAAFVVLAFMWTLWFDHYWKATALGFCTVVLLAATFVSLSTGRTEPLFVSVLLLLFGAGSLVPWDARWQSALTLVCLGWLAVNAIWQPSHDPDVLYRWLGLMAAAGLAQVGAARNEHLRKELESRAQLLAR